MIRLSRMTDYAVALLTQMVSEAKSIWAASDLADRTGLPLPTVAKILKRLTKAGIITARRGSLGGYSLSLAARSLSIATVIEAMDGPIAITDCASGGDHSCNIESICPMNNGWNMVNHAIRQALEEVSLADMAFSSAPSTARMSNALPSLHTSDPLEKEQKVQS